MTATQLFAQARGVTVRTGPHRCLYCGGACPEGNPAKQYLKSPQMLPQVTAPGSDWVCDGCVCAMDERAEITLPDGTRKTGAAGKVRLYSWVVTQGAATAATKSHLDWLRLQCLEPPEPPYCIVLSDSGQRHLLYRAPVNWLRSVCTVLLEEVPVQYGVSELQQRIELCMLVVAVLGKRSAAAPLGHRDQMRLIEHYGHEDVWRRWQACCSRPLTDLALWLCPRKEDCRAATTTA